MIMYLGQLFPDDLLVDIYYGHGDSKAEFIDRSTVTLRDFTQEDSRTIFRREIPCDDVSRFGFRILPYHPLLNKPYSLGLILWR